MPKSSIQFLLNHQLIQLTDVGPNRTVLQYLRENMSLTGTKEGCGSGDCGACTVVIAQLCEADAQSLVYQSINACITFLVSLHGKQLITIEHLKQLDQWHPVQQSMLNEHASQCGFCTPGIVMSSFALHKKKPIPDREEVVDALAGNLCRCTGYRSIIDAVIKPISDKGEDTFSKNHAQTVKQLNQLKQLPAVGSHSTGEKYFAAKNIQQLSQYLLNQPQATLVAGATDLALAVTQDLQTIEPLVYLAEVQELNTFSATADEWHIGAAVNYSRCLPFMEKNYAELANMIKRIGSQQIRNSGTLGGNIANASPIGDMPPALIVLGAKILLQKGDVQRRIKLEDFFTGYKTTQLTPSEFIRTIIIPKTESSHQLKLYKISKRFDDDISALLAAILIQLENQQVVSIRIAFGGMAEIPKRAKNCEQALQGKSFNQHNIAQAQQALLQDFQPLSDVRASQAYRIKVAQNLLQKCYIELTQPKVATRVVNYG